MLICCPDFYIISSHLASDLPDQVSLSSISTLDEDQLLEDLEEDDILAQTIQEEEHNVINSLSAEAGPSSEHGVDSTEAHKEQLKEVRSSLSNEEGVNHMETPPGKDDVLDELLMPPPWVPDSAPKGLRPSPLSLGLKETIEECMRVPEESGKHA